MNAPAEAVRNRDHAAALVGTLIAGGVRHAVVSPGSRNTPIVLALVALAEHDRRLRLHSVLDERAAGFFALGLARVTGMPTLLSCTSGSAGAHYLPAIIEAFHAHVPLIAITADRPPELQGRGAPQTIDQRGLYGPHVRASLELTPPKDGPQVARQAATAALEAGRGHAPGPVHINAQFRKPLWHPEVPPSVDTAAPPRGGLEPLMAAPAEVERLAARLEGVERGAVVWGPDPDPRIDPTPIQRLAEALGWPVLADPTSPARFRSALPVISAHDAFLRDADTAAALRPELVLQLGGTPSSNALRALVGGASDVVAIDPRGVWRDPEHALKHLVVADPGPLASALLERLERRTPGPWLAAWTESERVATDALRSAVARGWWSGSIVDTLLCALPEGALLHAASSMPIRDLDTFGRPDGRWRLATASRGCNGIDGTLATVLGMASAWDRGPVAALLGDLAFLHDQSSLMLADSVDGPVVFVVVDNGGGGIFEYLPIAEHTAAFEPWFRTPQTADIPSLCRGAGVRCTQVRSTGALRTALDAALSDQGVTVLHLPVDPADDLQRHRDAFSQACGR